MDEKKIRKNELDEIMDKIELLFLKNATIEEKHNRQYIKHQDFLDEIKKLLKQKFYCKNNSIQRYNITPIIENTLMTGIEYQYDPDGVWVNYNDVRNYIEDSSRVIENLKNCISLLSGEHRMNNNGF